jgi:putative glutamine amidotransferase
VVGESETAVKSHHHQGVDELGEGVEASGWSDDGVVEAIELPGHSFALGVLWHPEEDEASRVIGALVEEARARRAPG